MAFIVSHLVPVGFMASSLPSSRKSQTNQDHAAQNSEDKTVLRKRLRVLRARIDEPTQRAAAQAVVQAGVALCQTCIPAHHPPAQKLIVAGYAPIGSEFRCFPLLFALHDAGFQVALPVVTKKEEALSFALWTPGSKTRTGAFGIEEPSPSTSAISDSGAISGSGADQGSDLGPVLHDKVRPDVVLVPLLGFDPVGSRLGYGGGYYDRTLAELRAEQQPKRNVIAVGLAYEAQKVAFIPTDDHDQPLSFILTEKTLHYYNQDANTSSGNIG